MKEPGPDHPITVRPHAGRIVVTFAGRTIADTRSALTLAEAGYAPVHYVPREDVDMTALEPTERATRCPYKGEAGYFSIRAEGELSPSAAWTYEHPYPAVAQIAGHLAFHPGRVDAIEERPGRALGRV